MKLTPHPHRDPGGPGQPGTPHDHPAAEIKFPIINFLSFPNGPGTSYALDSLGNWATWQGPGVTQTRTFNAGNEITGVTGGRATPTYNRAGDMTFDGTYHYTYDAWNRLTRVYNEALRCFVWVEP